MNGIVASVQVMEVWPLGLFTVMRHVERRPSPRKRILPFYDFRVRPERLRANEIDAELAQHGDDERRIDWRERKVRDADARQAGCGVTHGWIYLL
jgi:hypothetical protein